MKKITELTEVKKKTTPVKDAAGNRTTITEEYIGPREVRSVAPGLRFGHYLFDAIIFNIIVYSVEFMRVGLTQYEQPRPLGPGWWGALFLTMFISSFLTWTCYVFCEHYWQKTPGKFLTRTVVIDEYGNKPALGTLMLRNLCRLIPFEPFSCFDGYSYGWHDSLSKTWVVPEEELARLKKLQAEQSDGDAGLETGTDPAPVTV